MALTRPVLSAAQTRLREVSSLRSCVGDLRVTCSSLEEENQRLRTADCSEELLSDALQQLLGEKSALLQEVSRLARQNQALQGEGMAEEFAADSSQSCGYCFATPAASASASRAVSESGAAGSVTQAGAAAVTDDADSSSSGK
eukprot:gene3499-3768_t